MATQVLRKLFTVEQYHRMHEVGVLTDTDRVELIRGEIIQMSPIGTKHAACVMRLIDLFSQALGQRVLTNVQNPLKLANDSEPQPDVCLLKRKDDYYASAHPTPADVYLVIEVADTTIDFDRTSKMPLYAESGIIELWLVNLNDQCIEVYREPQADRYENISKHDRTQSISPLAFADLAIAVEQILGKAAQD
jgi:Uma2 family endonuclease